MQKVCFKDVQSFDDVCVIKMTLLAGGHVHEDSYVSVLYICAFMCNVSRIYLLMYYYVLCKHDLSFGGTRTCLCVSIELYMYVCASFWSMLQR